MQTIQSKATETEVPLKSDMKSGASGLTIYPIPVEEDPATDYTLTVNGRPVITHRARVSAHPVNKVWPGCQRSKVQTEIASFASWDMSEPVEVSILSRRPVRDVRVRPSSAGITPRVEGDQIRFAIAKPGQFTVEVNGTHNALHLFVNPTEDAAPDPKDRAVRYFGPGVHCPGIIRLESNQTVYLAAGAVVYGAILAEKAANITILGRGILDGSKFDRLDGLTALVCLYDCDRVRLEGITLRDSAVFTITPIACRRVNLSNIKIIGNWRYNSDGINFINCRECNVEDSFIRTFDDCICLKGYEKFGAFVYPLQLLDNKWDGSFTVDGKNSHSFGEWQRRLGAYACDVSKPISGIQVRHCVLWNDWGKALEIGIETITEEISDILFDNCDIIHVAGTAMDVMIQDRARCKNILFRDIRVEFDDDFPRSLCLEQNQHHYELQTRDNTPPFLVTLEVNTGYVTVDTVRGHIDDVRFENIEVASRWMPRSRIHGYDAEHLVQRVRIENLCINGQKVTSLEAGGFKLNEFVKDISLK